MLNPIAILQLSKSASRYLLRRNKAYVYQNTCTNMSRAAYLSRPQTVNDPNVHYQEGEKQTVIYSHITNKIQTWMNLENIE